MSSNEHPDMSGNPMDTPYICDMCGCAMDIDKAYGSKWHEDKIFCCNSCAVEYDQKLEEGSEPRDDTFSDEYGS